MNGLRWMLAVWVALALSGCGVVATTTLEKEGKSVQSLYQTVAASDYPVDMVIYHEGKKSFASYRSDDAKEVEAFAAAYERFTGNEAPEYSGTMVIARMGTQNTGGYSFEVCDIRSQEGRTTVTLKIVKPTGLVTEALTSPYLIFLLPGNFDDIDIVEVK